MTSLTGRDEELALIHRRWRSATKGEGRVVLVSGEAGIGKSRIVEAFYADIEKEPNIRLRYQCSPFHTGSALYPFITQLAHAAGINDRDSDQDTLDKLESIIGQAVDDLPKVAPLFAHLLSIPHNGRYRPLDQSREVIKEMTKAAILDQFFGLAKSSPLIVVFEDIHWIDPSTEEILSSLVDRIESKRILLLCTFRPEHQSVWTGQASVSTIHLSRLDHRRSLELIERLRAGQDLAAETTDAIINRTEGVPLFIEELTRTVLEANREKEAQSEEGVTEHTAPLALPSTLNELLMAKLDSLSDTSDVIPVCAAIGRTFDFRLLAIVSGIAEDRLQAILERLVQAQIMVQHRKGPEVTYSFRHALIQEAAYATMLKSRVKSLHANIAETLVREIPDYATRNPEVVAHHYSRSAMPKQARDFWASAGNLAIERSAYIEAIAHLKAALEENAKLDDKHDRVTSEIALREQLVIPLEGRFWGSDDIAANFNRLHELQSEYGDDRDLFAVLDGLYGTHIIGGEPDLALEFASKMVEIAKSQDEDAFSLMSQHAMGMCHFAMGNFKEAIDHFALAIELRSRASEDIIGQLYLADLGVVDQCMQSWSYVLSGQAALAQAAIQRAQSITEAADQEFSRAYGFSVLASAHQVAGDEAACLDYASRALEISRGHKFRYWEAWAQIMYGWATATHVDHNRGIEELMAGLEGYINTGSKQIVGYAKTLLADVYLRAGRLNAGLSVIEEIESQQEHSSVRFHQQITARVARELWAAGDARK